MANGVTEPPIKPPMYDPTTNCDVALAGSKYIQVNAPHTLPVNSDEQANTCSTKAYFCCGSRRGFM